MISYKFFCDGIRHMLDAVTNYFSIEYSPVLIDNINTYFFSFHLFYQH